MEYCSGGDLSRFIHSRRVLPEDIARRFLRQLGRLSIATTKNLEEAGKLLLDDRILC